MKPYRCTTRRPVLFLPYRGAHGAGGRTACFLHSCTISSISFGLHLFLLSHHSLSLQAQHVKSLHFSFIITQPHWHIRLDERRRAYWVGFTQINNDCQGITGKSERNPINHPVSLLYWASSFLSAGFFSPLCMSLEERLILTGIICPQTPMGSYLVNVRYSPSVKENTCGHIRSTKKWNLGYWFLTFAEKLEK